MKRQKLRALAVLLAIVGTVLGAGPVSAAPEQPMGTNGVITRWTPVPANGKVSCYGYTGTFRAGTHVMVVDWATTRDECFGIATDRTIWHTWPGSGGWTPMPGNGHADYIYPDIAEYLDENNDVHRVVVVEIPGAARPFWCQEFYLGFWQGWVSC
jgi:hypothetical protein